MALLPRIGISSNFMHADPQRALFKGKTLQYLEEKTALALYRAGAVPLLVPDLKDDAGIDAVLDAVDGIVLAGGADLAPRSYGEDPIDAERWPGDAIRDRYELRLVASARRRGMPVLGLCRGAQLINVAFGGTLWQDIATQVPGSLVHRDWEHYDELSHEVAITPGSWIGQRYGGVDRLVVNTVHHQGIKALGAGLVATAWAPDGLVEAFEAIDREHDLPQWVVAVQWHPEWLDHDRAALDAYGRADGAPVFEAFVQACRDRAPSATLGSR